MLWKPQNGPLHPSLDPFQSPAASDDIFCKIPFKSGSNSLLPTCLVSNGNGERGESSYAMRVSLEWQPTL